ncbi:MAG TPA: DinB family protein [Terriglobales bacterium]|nr:DinB family protein [Terriglobales bacterium]
MPTPWITRTFNFSTPIDLYPGVLARYRGTPARLEDAVHALSRDALIFKPDGKWSIQENAGHLLDEEALFSTRLQEFLRGSDTLTPAPYLHRELTHNNNNDIHHILRDFRQARELQVCRLESLSPDDFARTAYHARLNVRMRLLDHLIFIAEHDDHHLARIWEIRCR